ncbi:MAG: MerR family transcriptional regulator [Gammaproteobacteria bacterium]
MPRQESIDYGIGSVARLTGLTTHTIRAWEKRHGAVTASRDAAGRRRYSPADVERLTKLKQLVDLGERIGGLAQHSAQELDARLAALDTVVSPAPERAAPLRVGIYGAGANALAALLADHADRFDATDVRIDATPESLVDDALDVDCVLLDTASVAPNIVGQLESLARRSAGDSLILIYSFARDEDLRRLAAAGVGIVRSPASAADVTRALHEAREKRASATTLNRSIEATPERHPAGETPRFTAAELTKIGSISTSIDCECPHHLATVINNLRAFERYSAECANLKEADAAMHEFLYRETVRASQIIENALRHLMTYEGIDLETL